MAPKKRKSEAKEAPAAKGKKAKTTEADGDKGLSKSDAEVVKGIVIEAWANKLQKLLTSGNSGLSVTINPTKPRKGCFEVRHTENGETFVSLLDMPRPFTKLKALDIEKLAEEILGKVDA